MTNITDDIAFGDSTAEVKDKIEDILDFWGKDTSNISTWGDARNRLNTLLDGTSLGSISNGEPASTFVPKINGLNSPEDFIAGELFGADEDGTITGNPFETFTDTAGTTPADWGDSIARVDDQSGNARHAVQSSAALRPLLGRAPAGGRRNLLRFTEDFSDGEWGNPQGAAWAALPDDPFGAYVLTEDTSNGLHRLVPSGVQDFIEGQEYTASVEVKLVSGSRNFRIVSGSSGVINYASVFDLTSGAVVSGPGAIEALGDGWYKVQASAVAASTSQTQSHVFQLVDGTSAVYEGDGSAIAVRKPQLEAGPDATPYQRVGNALDVTEAGLPSPPFIRFDLSDDVLPTTFPDGGTFDVMVFGRRGSWIEREVTIAPGGSLSIGPDSFTGAPGDVLAALGDIVGWVAVDRTLTNSEVNRLVLYHKARGAKGLLVPGPELVDDFGTVGGATFDFSNRNLSVETGGSGGQGVERVITTVAGRAYRVTCELRNGTADSIQLRAGIGNSRTVDIFGSDVHSGASPLLVDRLFFAESDSVNIYFRVVGSEAGQTAFADNISVRELRPQEDW